MHDTRPDRPASLYTSLIPYASHIAQAFSEGDKAEALCEVKEIWGVTRPEAELKRETPEEAVELILLRSGEEAVYVSGEDAAKASRVHLLPGQFLAIYPGESYLMQGMTGDEPGPVEKWLCRLPCPPAFCHPQD